MTAAKKPRPRKQIKARRMYALRSDLAPNVSAVLHHSPRWGKVIAVAVIDISDEAALIEQLAMDTNFFYAVNDECYKSGDREKARAVLESLGIIKRKVRK